jgi:hypothetical protein
MWQKFRLPFLTLTFISVAIVLGSVMLLPVKDTKNARELIIPTIYSTS